MTLQRVSPSAIGTIIWTLLVMHPGLALIFVLLSGTYWECVIFQYLFPPRRKIQQQMVCARSIRL